MLILPQEEIWTQQPQVVTEVDRKWYEYGLKSVIVLVGNMVVDVSARRWRSNLGTAPTLSLGPMGMAARFNGSQSRRFPIEAMSAAPATRIVACTPLTNTGTFSGPDGGFNGFQMRLSSGEIQLLNSGTALVLGAGTVVANETCIIGGVYSSGRNEVWKNGVLLGSNTATTASNINYPHYIGQRGNGSEFYNGALYLHIDFGAALPRALVASLSANPWQIFAP